MSRHDRTAFNAQIYEEAVEWFTQCRASTLAEPTRRAFNHWLRKSPEHQRAYLEVAAIWDEGLSLDAARKWTTDSLVRDALKDDGNLVPWPAAVTHGRLPISESEQGVADGASQTVAGGGWWRQVLDKALGRSLPQRQQSNDLKPVAARISAPRTGRLVGSSLGALLLSRRGFVTAAAVTVVIGATIGTRFALVPDVYATGIGEIRTITLEDGSTVDLNTRTEVSVDFSRDQRVVTLIAGQAFFRVAHDAERPFLVDSGSAQIRAVGTEFDVYRKATDAVVTVVEGKVAVTAPALAGLAGTSAAGTVEQRSDAAGLVDGESRAVLLGAGDQMTVTSAGLQPIVRANIATAMAWTEGQIIFEAAPLTRVAEEFNRYNERPLVIASSGVPSFHVSGVFFSTDPASLIQFLRDRPDLRVVETPAEVRIEEVEARQ